MHLHAEHDLFFERRQNLQRPALSLVLTLLVLIVNAGANSILVSLVGSGVGLFLLFVTRLSGHRRMEPAILWTVFLVGFALLGSAALGGDVDRFIEVAARISCGMLWILWLGTQTDWASLRQILLFIRVPTNAVSALDHAVMNGVLTQREWIRRRDAARIRLGNPRLPLRSWGYLLGEGALCGFLRLEQMEEGALVRSSTIKDTGDDEAFILDAVQIERGGHSVLKQLDLRIETGEWVLLCGPSGAGKSSLLRLLAGLEEPTKGVMTRFGATISKGTKLPVRLDGRVALLTQNPEHHFIASTVAEDIAWGLLRRGVEEAEAKHLSRETAKALSIEHLLERPCHALSFGEQRRVALAGLLVLEPQFLLLDEPTSGLDPVAADQLRTLVGKFVQQTGATCVWATHDLYSLPPLAQRTVLLRDGQIVFDGPKTEGLSRPWMLRAGLAVAEEGED